jgi:hypothetical protein
MKFPVVVMSFLLLLGASAIAQPGTPDWGKAPARPDLNTIVTRMEQRQLTDRDRLVPYTVTREYALYGGDTALPPSSQVIADVSFLPPDHKSYEIKQSSGSGHGEKVVTKLLQHESEMTKTAKSVPISRTDYEFTDLGERYLNGRRCYVLETKAKRNVTNLVNGLLWVDADTFRIVRFEGQPAKSPSWWLKDMRVAMNYGWLGGMWMQTSTTGTADVRFFGRHTLIGRDVQVQTGEEVARKTRQSGNSRHQHEPDSALGTILPR